MVLLQKSERLDPKSSLAWLHSWRCVVWHAALRLLYLGQGAYFLYWYMGKWLIQMKPGIQQSTSQAFTPTRVGRGAGGHGSWGMHTHWHKMGQTKWVSPASLEFLLWKVGVFPAFFWVLLLFMSTKPGQGISAWDLPVKHLWGIRTCFRNLIFPFIIHSLRLSTEMSWI